MVQTSWMESNMLQSMLLKATATFHVFKLSMWAVLCCSFEFSVNGFWGEMQKKKKKKGTLLDTLYCTSDPLINCSHLSSPLTHLPCWPFWIILCFQHQCPWIYHMFHYPINITLLSSEKSVLDRGEHSVSLSPPGTRFVDEWRPT